MYKMIKCIKCGCTQIKEGTLAGPTTLSLAGVPNWLEDYKTCICERCGYTELVKENSKKSYKGSALGG